MYRRQEREETNVTALYTFDVFSTLDGYGSYGPEGDWGGYWGKQGPEFLDRRLALYREPQRLVRREHHADVHAVHRPAHGVP
jgi:hypothetical protein